MKAAQINEYGDVSVLEVVEINKPTINDGQVLVEVHAASLNPFDTSVRAGYLQQSIPLQLPVTLGGDIAGKIVEIGADVTGFAIGDSVYGQASVVGGNSGSFAEFAATKASQIAKMPSGIDYVGAASLTLVGVSAQQVLTQHIDLRAGQKIFITGGAGGIGQIAIQIAKHLGAYVATTVSTNDVEAIKVLGADEAIDYKSQDFTELLRDYDAVFDTVGGEGFAATLNVLKRGGVAVSMVAQVDEEKVQELGLTVIRQSTKVTTEALGQLRELIESGVVKPNVGKVFSLQEIQEAFIARESGSVSGKIVLAIK